MAARLQNTPRDGSTAGWHATCGVCFGFGGVPDLAWTVLHARRRIRSPRDVWANVEDRALALRLSPHRSSPAAVQGIGLERKCRAPNPDEQSMTVESPTMRTIRIVAGVQKLLKGTIIWLRWPATSGI